MSNEMLFRVLGSKFGMGYLKFLKKDRKKLLKEKNAMLLDILQTEASYIDLDTIIVYSFIFILFYFLKFHFNIVLAFKQNSIYLP